MLPISVEHIAKTPGVCGGRACIAGHRIRVMDIVAGRDAHGRSPEDIAAGFPGLTMADVYAALAYYHDHRDEIDADFEQDRQWEAFGKTQPSLVREPTGD